MRAPIRIPKAPAVALQIGAQAVIDHLGAPILLGDALLEQTPRLAKMFRTAAQNAATQLNTKFTKRHVWPEVLSLYSLCQIAEHGFKQAAKLKRRAWRMQSLVKTYRPWDVGTVVLLESSKQRGTVTRIRYGHPKTGLYQMPIAQYLIRFKDRSEVWYWRSELVLAPDPSSVQPLEESTNAQQQQETAIA